MYLHVINSNELITLNVVKNERNIGAKNSNNAINLFMVLIQSLTLVIDGWG